MAKRPRTAAGLEILGANRDPDRAGSSPRFWIREQRSLGRCEDVATQSEIGETL